MEGRGGEGRGGWCWWCGCVVCVVCVVCCVVLCVCVGRGKGEGGVAGVCVGWALFGLIQK